MTRLITRRAALAAGALVVAAAAVAPPALAAEPTDPAAQRIAAFDAGLLEVMKDAKALGVEGRYRKLQPLVARAFNAAFMIRVAAGPAWTSFTAAQQGALTEAFARLTAASYAHNFNGYSGESFALDPTVYTRVPDKVVTTRIVSPHDAPVTIAYRMQEAPGGGWKIVDVLYNGSISQLTTRRADFAASLAQGGAAGLLAHLNALVDKQLK